MCICVCVLFTFFVIFADPPLVTLRLGSTLSPDDIKEGDDVYFECHVQSNPQWRKLLWLHNVSIAANIRNILNMEGEVRLTHSNRQRDTFSADG